MAATRVEVIGAASMLAYLFLPWPKGVKPPPAIIALYFLAAALVVGLANIF